MLSVRSLMNTSKNIFAAYQSNKIHLDQLRQVDARFFFNESGGSKIFDRDSLSVEGNPFSDVRYHNHQLQLTLEKNNTFDFLKLKLFKIFDDGSSSPFDWFNVYYPLNDNVINWSELENILDSNFSYRATSFELVDVYDIEGYESALSAYLSENDKVSHLSMRAFIEPRTNTGSP